MPSPQANKGAYKGTSIGPGKSYEERKGIRIEKLLPKDTPDYWASLPVGQNRQGLPWHKRVLQVWGGMLNTTTVVSCYLPNQSTEGTGNALESVTRYTKRQLLYIIYVKSAQRQKCWSNREGLGHQGHSCVPLFIYYCCVFFIRSSRHSHVLISEVHLFIWLHLYE